MPGMNYEKARCPPSFEISLPAKALLAIFESYKDEMRLS